MHNNLIGIIVLFTYEGDVAPPVPNREHCQHRVLVVVMAAEAANSV